MKSVTVRGFSFLLLRLFQGCFLCDLGGLCAKPLPGLGAVIFVQRPRSDERGYGRRDAVMMGCVIFANFCGGDFFLRRIGIAIELVAE